MTRILVTGKRGQVGFELQRSLALCGEVIALDRNEFDLSDAEQMQAVLAQIKPDIIANSAAYTLVDKAETETAAAAAVNATAPAVLAGYAARHGALLIHYSTDYVFDGQKPEPYTENDAVAPVSVYGKTKLAGEEAIRSACPAHVILRTSWVYGAWGNNFLKTILRLAADRDALKVVADQIGAPTSASLIADVTAVIVRQYLQAEKRSRFAYGTYNLVAEGNASWYEYACHVVEQARQSGFSFELDPAAISPIATSDYPLPAPRPANSRLCTDKIRNTFNLTLPAWQDGVNHVIALLAK